MTLAVLEVAVPSIYLETLPLASFSFLQVFGSLVLTYFSMVCYLAFDPKLLDNTDLQQGYNAPGLFRVPGTSITYNAMYDYLDQQFLGAGSPSKVEKTVGIGAFPEKFNYTLNDIASLFTMIIRGLPGCALGSPGLFAALCDAQLNLSVNAGTSERDSSKLRAHLTALAISSVQSKNRQQLIQSALGLFASLASAGDDIQQAERKRVETSGTESPHHAEIMGYKAMSLALGPLMLVDVHDSVDNGDLDARTADKSLSKTYFVDHSKVQDKHPGKQVHFSVTDKVSHKISTETERFKAAGNMLESLLRNWKDVVDQLREIHKFGSAATQFLLDKHQIASIPDRVASRSAVQVYEDEINASDSSRGKSTLKGSKMTARLPITSVAREASGESLPGHSMSSKANSGLETAVRVTSNAFHSLASRRTGSDSNASLPSVVNHPAPYTEDLPAVNSKPRTDSDLAMEQMAKGTILTPRDNRSFSSQRDEIVHSASPLTKLHQKLRGMSSDQTSNAAVGRDDLSEPRHASTCFMEETENDRLQATQRDAANRAAIVISTEDDIAIAQQEDGICSLPKEQQASENTRGEKPSSCGTEQNRTPTVHTSSTERLSIATTLLPASHSGGQAAFANAESEDESVSALGQSSSQKECYSISNADTSLTTEVAVQDQESSSNAEANFSTQRYATEQASHHQEHKTIIVVAQHNLVGTCDEPSLRHSHEKKEHRGKAAKKSPHRIHAYINEIPQQNSPHGLAASANEIALKKEVRIPQPRKGNSRGRDRRKQVRLTRTPSPVKNIAIGSGSATPKRRSIPDNFRDQNVPMAKANGLDRLGPITDPRPGDGYGNPSEIVQGEQSQQVSSGQADASISRRLFSYQSGDDFEKTSTNSHTNGNVSDNDIRLSNQSDAYSTIERRLNPASPSRINSNGMVNDTATEIERRNSRATALYEENRSLRQQLDQIQAEERVAQRNLDATREATKSRDSSMSRGSWGTNKIYEELEQTRRETELYRTRAEAAERRVNELQDQCTQLESRVADLDGLAYNLTLTDVPGVYPYRDVPEDPTVDEQSGNFF